MDDLTMCVEAAALRIRLAQATLSDEEEPTRGAYLSDAVATEVEAVAPDKRTCFLAALSRQFPLLEDEGVRYTGGHKQAEPTTTETDDLESFVKRLSADERDELQILLAGGASPGESDGTEVVERVDGVTQSIERNLGIGELDLGRAITTLDLLVDFIRKADQVAWQTWRVTAPSSKLHRGKSLDELLRRFLGGDEVLDAEAVKHETDKLCRLIAALVTVVGQIGAQVSREHFARFSPEEIEALVGVEGGGLLKSREIRCWRKYVELTGTYSESRIEREIQGSIVRYAESLTGVS